VWLANPWRCEETLGSGDMGRLNFLRAVAGCIGNVDGGVRARYYSKHWCSCCKHRILTLEAPVITLVEVPMGGCAFSVSDGLR
jgi:hypothetical protein